MNTQIMKRYFYVLVALFSVLLSVPAHAERTVTYYHTDVLGSIVAATDEGGDVVWRKTYDPYGNEVIEPGESNQNNVNGDLEVQTYTGKPYDEETGLVYLSQRYYDPQIRRFMGIDPVGFRVDTPVSFNRYAYANNNPYKFVDPDGRAANLAVQGGYLGARRTITPAINYMLRYFTGVGSLGATIYNITHDDEFVASQPPLISGTHSATGGPGLEPDDEDDIGNNRYENPGHHDPSGRGPNSYNSSKSVLPRNHEKLWGQSRLGADGNRWTKVGRGRKAVYHRFQNDGNGNWHWNGSTNGVTKNGSLRAVKLDDVPIGVRR